MPTLLKSAIVNKNILKRKCFFLFVHVINLKYLFGRKTEILMIKKTAAEET